VTGAVAVIGTGHIGGGVAASLLRTGASVVVRDIRPEATVEFAGRARIAGSAREAVASCAAALIAVVDEDQVRDVLWGRDGLLEAAEPPPIAGVLSTISVRALTECAARAAERGVALLDCAVTGAASGAREGRLVSLVGGTPDDFARLRPVLEGYSVRVLHVGGLGAGLKAKLARNLLTYGTLLAAHEARLLAERSGVNVETLAEAIRVSDEQIGGSARHLLRVAGTGGRRGDPGRSEAAASARLLHKDLSAARELAAELGLALPLAEHVERRAEEIFGLAEGGRS